MSLGFDVSPFQYAKEGNLTDTFFQIIDPKPNPNPEQVEQNSPFNIAWNSETSADLTASKVAEEFTEGGWTQNNSNPLVVKVDQYLKTYEDGSFSPNFKLTDEHVMKPEFTDPFTGIDSTSQYHIRLYDVPESADANVDVVGQAHFDPIDHGKIESKFNDVDYKLNEAREEAVEFWKNRFESDEFSIEKEPGFNETTEFSSHDGDIAIIDVTDEEAFVNEDSGFDFSDFDFPEFTFSLNSSNTANQSKSNTKDISNQDPVTGLSSNEGISGDISKEQLTGHNNKDNFVDSYSSDNGILVTDSGATSKAEQEVADISNSLDNLNLGNSDPVKDESITNPVSNDQTAVNLNQNDTADSLSISGV